MPRQAISRQSASCLAHQSASSKPRQSASCESRQSASSKPRQSASSKPRQSASCKPRQSSTTSNNSTAFNNYAANAKPRVKNDLTLINITPNTKNIAFETRRRWAYLPDKTQLLWNL
jgi:hypothetical protein